MVMYSQRISFICHTCEIKVLLLDMLCLLSNSVYAKTTRHQLNMTHISKEYFNGCDSYHEK